MIVETQDMNVAYEAYVKNAIMRKDLFRTIIDNILADRARMQAVLDAEEDRRATIAAFRARLGEIEHRLNALDDEIDTKVATAANSAVSILGKMQNGEAKRRGRPPTAVAMIEEDHA